jgi:hypothetical protein
MQIMYVQNPILSKTFHYFIKDGKKLANIFQRKENGAIHKKF